MMLSLRNERIVDLGRRGPRVHPGLQLRGGLPGRLRRGEVLRRHHLLPDSRAALLPLHELRLRGAEPAQG